MAVKKTQSRLNLFAKLILSYCVCLVIVAAFAGSTIYARVLGNYRRELDELSSGVTTQYADILQTRVIESAENCALDFILGRSSDITVQTVLSSSRLPLHIAYIYKDDFTSGIKRYVPMVSDIRIYNVSQNTFLSKTVGLYYIDDHRESNAYPNRWLAELRESSGNWLSALPAEYPGIEGWQLSYTASYPLNVSFENARGYIVVDVNESYLRDILNSVSPGSDETLLVVNADGRVISSQNADWISLTMPECGLPTVTTLSENADIAEFRTENGRQTLCYSAPLSNGWRVLRILPTGVFYASLTSMRTSLLTAGFAALGVGLILALVFSHRMYKPVRTITRWLSTETPFQITDGHVDEYAFIDNAIKGMTSTISQMQTLVDANRLLVKEHLIASLIDGSLLSMDTFRMRMKQLGLKSEEGSYNIVRLTLSNTMMNAPEPEHIEMIKRDIIERLETLSGEETLILASSVKNDEIAALVISANQDLSDWLEKIGLILLEQYERHIEMSIGSWQPLPLKLHQSYLDAQKAQLYHFFHPDWLYSPWPMIDGKQLDDCSSLNMHADTFVAAVKNACGDDAIDEVHLFSYDAQDHVYSYEDAMAALKRMQQVVDAAATGEAREAMDAFLEKSGLYRNIREYALELCRITRLALEPSSANDESRPSQQIEWLRHFISQNLHTDLSLTSLADSVHLSSSYLSRLFKKETGVTVTDYITAERLEKARQLLEQTDQSIENITQQVGYPTHHYFTKRFKQRYGVTPKEYRQQYRLAPEEKKRGGVENHICVSMSSGLHGKRALNVVLYHRSARLLCDTPKKGCFGRWSICTETILRPAFAEALKTLKPASRLCSKRVSQCTPARNRIPTPPHAY